MNTGSHPPRGILFIALHTCWMRPFTHTALQRLWEDGSQLLVTDFPGEREEYPEIPEGAVHRIKAPESYLGAKLFAFHAAAVARKTDELIRLHNPRAVVSLTIDQPLQFYLPRLQRRIPVVYFTHDCRPHRHSASNPLRSLLHTIIYSLPIRRLVRRMDHQIVCARWQQEYLRGRYPDKTVGYRTFPSLVTDEIAQGTDTVPELEGISGPYILYFGNVHPYKGVDLLLDAYESDPDLRKYTLVIAGKGYLTRKTGDGVIRIDRFIPDSQLGDLFRGASAVVYPYREATQSGVLSIASWFGRPIAATPVPFFREMMEGEPGCHLARSHAPAEIASAISRALTDPSPSRPLFDRFYACQHWDPVC